MEEEQYGIDIDHAHERAKALIAEEFFWSCTMAYSTIGSANILRVAAILTRLLPGKKNWFRKN